MLKSLFVMAFAVFGMLSSAQADDHMDMKPLANDTDKPTIALFHWCGSCKVLGPKMKEAMDQLENKDALKVVKFDLTDDATKAKSAAMAAENNLTDLYNDLAPKTGFAVLVNDSGENPMTITKTDSVEVIKAKLETYIATRS
jgi:thiol-disulfide isomerase/thioredoxin